MMTRPVRVSVVASVSAVATLMVQPVTAQVVDSTTLRPTDVEVTIVNDRENDGTYRTRQISLICGKMDLMMPHRANSFHVEFPHEDTNLPVRSITFDADTLAPGTSTTSYMLNVGVRTPNGGTPLMYVVRANEPHYNEPGKATRTKKASTDVLDIEGVATTGTKVRLTMKIVCHPKP
jgi:hypothetical protein